MNLTRLWVKALGGSLACWASTVHAQTLQCPPSVRLQVKSIAPFAPDGALGSIRGFGQVFSPRRVRLVGVEIGTVREGESAPSFPIEPDDLMAQLGRRATYTLWNGAPPAPDGVLHLVCQYEGGLVLNRAVGSRIRRCELTTTVQGKAAQGASKPKAAASKKERAAAEAERAAANSEAADFPTESSQSRPVATKAVLSCR